MSSHFTNRNVESKEMRSAGFSEAFKILRPYWKSLVVAFIVGVIGSGISAAQPLVVSTIIDSFGGSLPVGWVSLLIALLLGGAVLTALRELVVERTGEQYAYDSRIRLLKHIFSLSVSSLDDRDKGDLVTRVTTDVSETRSFLTSGLVDVAVSVVTVLFSLVMMALIDAPLLVLSMGSVLGTLLTVLSIGKRTRPIGLVMQDSLGLLAESVSRTLASIRTVRATRATGREIDMATNRANRVREAGFISARLRAILQTISGASVQIILIVVVGVGALRVSAGRLTTGELSAFIMYLMMMITPIMMIGGVVASLGEAFGSLSRIREIEQEPVELDIVGSFDKESNEPRREHGILTFSNVSFRYPHGNKDAKSSTPWALQNINIDVKRGEVIAFVGPSGAGKSTLFALLERFYEPTFGNIYFKGKNVLNLSRNMVREELAYVDQDAEVLQGSIRDNLLLGKSNATYEECITVLKAVNLVRDTSSAGDYLNQQIGDLGRRLSGGERQRLAIARSLLGGASILLLDEATSNLDSKNEAAIQDAIAFSGVDRTKLVIAHRFSTVVSADRIIVLDNGKIVAQGRHSELLEASPLYRELAERQFIVKGEMDERR